MDPNGHIYGGPEDEIPETDKARLDGFLRGRAEADRKELVEEEMARLRAEQLERAGG